MRAAKVDQNQKEIVEALRGVGCSVAITSAVGGGFPDIVVGFRGQSFLLEIKTRTGKLNQLQVQWHQTWNGQVASVRTIDEALKVVGAIQD